MEGPLGLLILAAIAVFVGGPILGIIAYFGNRNTRTQADRLQQQLNELHQRLRNLESGAGPLPTRAPAPAPDAAPLSGMAPTSAPVTPQPAPPARSIDDALAAMADVTRKVTTPTVTPYATSSTGDFESTAPSQPAMSIDTTQSPAEVLGLTPAATAQPTSEPVTSDSTPELQPIGPVPPPPGAPPVRPVPPPPPRNQFEVNLGTKWLIWVGGLFMIMFAAYGLKYAYDNSWIGPKGRLAIATLFGVGAIMLGERFRRRNWGPLFQTLTGIGLATFYACIFFSFQVYKLSAAGPSFGLAILVTGLAVTLAVFHNTISIAIMAAIGGFLSPVLLSSGENHPYALFSYIACLNLVAMGAAYFRRWHALELLCFAGTALMYVGWCEKYGMLPGQLQPALIFISLFYLMFLLIPTIHTLTRGLPDTREGTLLVVFNALFSALMYYRLLYPAHTHALGFIVIGQAVLIFVLFRIWTARLGTNNNTAHSLLMIALALIIAAVPLHLSRYGIPIVWALEGVLLAYVGTRYRNAWTRGMSVVALFLATFSLRNHFPIHTMAFTPVVNVAFGSWLLVAASSVAASWLHWNRTPPETRGRQLFTGATFLLGLGLFCYLLTIELVAYWRENYVGTYREHYTLASVLVLWSTISVVAITVLERRRMLHGHWQLLAVSLYIATSLMFLAGLPDYKVESNNLFFNSMFLTRMVYCVAVWWAAGCFARANKQSNWRPAFESLGFIALAILLAFEFPRWSRYSEAVSQRMAFSLISVAWALEAFGLIWFGLATHRRLRRILGFALFAVVVLKVLLVDTSELEKVYRILSFGATGLMLLAAGYFFQKYSASLLQEQEPTPEEPIREI